MSHATHAVGSSSVVLHPCSFMVVSRNQEDSRAIDALEKVSCPSNGRSGAFTYQQREKLVLKEGERKKNSSRRSRQPWDDGASTCTIEKLPNLVRRHLVWERVYHQFKVFLTITFLLRFGRAGVFSGVLGVLACWVTSPLQPGGRLTSVRVIRCRMPTHKKLGIQKSSMQPHIDARHNHPLCCTS